MQQDDGRVAFRAPLTGAEDEASQGETTSVETPEGRLQRLDARESRRDRDREVNLRHIIRTYWQGKPIKSEIEAYRAVARR